MLLPSVRVSTENSIRLKGPCLLFVSDDHALVDNNTSYTNAQSVKELDRKTWRMEISIFTRSAITTT